MIVIPAAGVGQRFKEAGYKEPKHLIRLAGKPMLRLVQENLMAFAPWDAGGVVVVTRSSVGSTRGTAETLARAFAVPPSGELLIGNCDQLLKAPDYDWRRGDGVVFTFPSANPAHSYVSLDIKSRITSIVEKQVVSDHAVSGVYWFREAKTILDACDQVCRHDGELYLSRAIALLLPEFLIFAHQTPTAILGTPEDLQRFAVALELCQGF